MKDEQGLTAEGSEEPAAQAQWHILYILQPRSLGLCCQACSSAGVSLSRYMLSLYFFSSPLYPLLNFN